MTYLPWMLLLTTLTVRALIAYRNRAAFWLDIGSIPAWLYVYQQKELYALLPIPLIFGALDLLALRRWAR